MAVVPLPLEPTTLSTGLACSRRPSAAARVRARGKLRRSPGRRACHSERKKLSGVITPRKLDSVAPAKKGKRICQPRACCEIASREPATAAGEPEIDPRRWAPPGTHGSDDPAGTPGGRSARQPLVGFPRDCLCPPNPHLCGPHPCGRQRHGRARRILKVAPPHPVHGAVSSDQPASLADVEAAIRARGVEWEIDPSLDRMQALMELLGSPQRSYAVIHVTGTNGKTSTANMIDSLLRARGLRTGRYTSPHLTSMRERISVDGEPVSEERFVAAYAEVLPYVQLADSSGDPPLSFFEVLTAMAFAVFADAPVDVAVIEVGMGGTWDATNVADGSVAVVTPISMDHTRYLGDTIELIAKEKAGIIKPGAVAVIAQQPVEAAEVLLRRAAETGASVAREGFEFGVLQRDVALGGQRLTLRGLRSEYDDLFLPLFGAHQASNAACALAAVEAFAGVPAGTLHPEGIAPVGDTGGALDAPLVREAFAQATSPGRLEVVRRSPTVLVDAAHNPAGMAATVAAVEESFAFAPLVGVVAVSADKDVTGILEELEPVLSAVVVTRIPPHAPWTWPPSPNSPSRSSVPSEFRSLAGSTTPLTSRPASPTRQRQRRKAPAAVQRQAARASLSPDRW